MTSVSPKSKGVLVPSLQQQKRACRDAVHGENTRQQLINKSVGGQHEYQNQDHMALPNV